MPLDVLNAPALGSDAKLCAGVEENYGTPALVTQAVPMLSESLTDDPNFIEDTVLMGRGVGRQPDVGNIPLKGNVKLRLRYLNQIFLLVQAFGTYLDLGNGEHVYKPKRSVFGQGVTLAFEDGQVIRQYSGGKVNKVVIDGKPGPLEVTIDLMFTGYTRASELNTHGVLAAIPFDVSDNALFTDSVWRFGEQGTVLTPDDEEGLEAWQVTFDRPMLEKYTNQSRYMVQPVDNGLRMSSMSFNEPFYQTTKFHDWRDQAARLQAELWIRAEHASHTKRIIMPGVTLKSVKAAIAGPPAIPLTMGADLRESERSLLSSEIEFVAGVAATLDLVEDGSAPANNSTVTVDEVIYTFKDTMTGADGEVHIGSATASLTNLGHAINKSGGTPGTDYKVATAHPTVSSGALATDTITLSYRDAAKGSLGNALTASASTSPDSHIDPSNSGDFSGGADNSLLISEGTAATGTLSVSGPVLDQESIRLGDDHYEVDTQSPARITAPNIRLDLSGGSTRQSQGTMHVEDQPTAGDPFTLGTKVYTFDAHNSLSQTDGHIEIGLTLAATHQNIQHAVNLTGIAGVGYAINMTKHPDVTIGAFDEDTNDAVLTAIVGGTAGDLIATTEDFTSANNTFDDDFLGTTQAGADPTDQEFIDALLAAILASGNAEAVAVQNGNAVDVTAEFVGTAGNSIHTSTATADGTVQALANGTAWGNTTLTGGAGSSDEFPYMQRFYDVVLSGASDAENNGTAPVRSWSPYAVVLEMAENGGLSLKDANAGDAITLTSRSYDMILLET
jgi:hypothetical protein